MSVRPRNDTDRALVSLENQLWRDVAGLMEEIEKDTAWIRRLVDEHQTTLTLSDLPLQKWSTMGALFKTIGELRGVKLRHRPRVPRAKKKA